MYLYSCVYNIYILNVYIINLYIIKVLIVNFISDISTSNIHIIFDFRYFAFTKSHVSEKKQ